MADSLKLAAGSAWLHFWPWPVNLLFAGDVPEGSLRDWLGLALAGAWFATGLISLIALVFVPRDLTRLHRSWQVAIALALIGFVVHSAAHWTP